MTPVNVVLLPYPVPMAGNTHWLIPRPRPYPRHVERVQWPLKTPPPIDRQAITRMLNEARRRLCEDRARALLRQLDR
jgi:hypothetical protein